MGLFVLFAALVETISETIREKREQHNAFEEQRRYENIDWDNIESVTLDGTETAYRIEEEEEFDIVKTNFLSEMDGWAHYETETVEYKIENGENYCFTIKYKDGTKIYRKFHETSPLTERLLTYVKEDSEPDDISVVDPITSRFEEIINDSLSLLDTTINPETYFSRYRIALDNAKRLLENTNVQHYKEYALDIINDLTENKTANYKEFIDRCYDEEVLYSYKQQFLSGAYELPVEVDKYVKSLLKKLETEEKANTPKERFAVIDLETTGLNYNFNRQPGDEIISVAIIDQDGNVLLDTYCDTVRIKSWDEAESIHGISPQDVKGYPTFVEILPKVVDILLSYDYVIAYNIKFEKLFIQNYAYHHARDYLYKYCKVKWGEDPMEMFMRYMNSEKFLKLEAAAEHFGYTYNAHNALEDTKAILYVYKALRVNKT